jgi:hypothetical protein
MEDNNGACFWDRSAKSDETESLLWEVMGNTAFLPHAAGFCLFLLGKPHVMRSYFLKSEKNWDSMGLQLGGEVYLHVVVVSSCSPRFIRILRVLPTR